MQVYKLSSISAIPQYSEIMDLGAVQNNQSLDLIIMQFVFPLSIP